ncbi:MAG: hypothetical protein M3245_02475 [Actinomycetota bacterium]|nr:hypothetical protein [Actinomycetota bacterium]
MVKDPASVREVRYLRMLGLGFWAAGFVIIWLGWNGAASLDYAQGQLPYLMSAGGAGIGLIIVGTALLMLAGLRTERMYQEERLQEVTRALDRLTSAVSIGAGIGSANGAGVIAGKTTYHRPDCRLVKGRDDLDMLTVDVAAEAGLTPCRVCKPAPPEPTEEPAAVSTRGSARSGRSSRSGRSGGSSV